MAFTAAFSILQAANLQNLTITDTSTGGTDPNIVDRQIFIYKVDNNTLVPTGTSTAFVDFPIITGIGDVINVNVLNKDYSLRVVINWISTSPISGAVYTASNVFTATGYTNRFLYSLIQNISANPRKLNDTNYYTNMQKCYTDLDSANQAQVYNDQFAAQNCLDRIFLMSSNQSKYF